MNKFFVTESTIFDNVKENIDTNHSKNNINVNCNFKEQYYG